MCSIIRGRNSATSYHLKSNLRNYFKKNTVRGKYYVNFRFNMLTIIGLFHSITRHYFFTLTLTSMNISLFWYFCRIRRRGYKFFKSKYMLLALVTLCILDCALVLGELILDLYKVKGKQCLYSGNIWWLVQTAVY